MSINVTHITALHGADVLPSGVHGAADPHFACLIKAFAALFPSRRLGGGAMCVYLDGRPVVDVWTGWSDRHGKVAWQADTGTMVFSATKGMTATVIHRLVDRGLLDYDTPVAEYWPAFGANGKAGITLRDVMAHKAGLSHLGGISLDEVLDHQAMEHRLAAAPVDKVFGQSAYHAVTFGWLISGLARAVTGKGMRELVRTELAEPLDTDGLHLGRPPVTAPTRVAQIVGPQGPISAPLLGSVMPRIAARSGSAILGAIYFPGLIAAVQGETQLLDTEMPSANAVVTARGLARMYGAIANDGLVDGNQFLSRSLIAGLAGRRSFRPDRNVGVPLNFHLGYHSVPVPAVMPGFGHVGLGGSVGWADPETGMAFAVVHNRLLTPLVVVDQTGFVGLHALMRRGVAAARARGVTPVTHFGAPYARPDAVAG